VLSVDDFALRDAVIDVLPVPDGEALLAVVRAAWMVHRRMGAGGIAAHTIR
jgi:hypothetical protein